MVLVSFASILLPKRLVEALEAWAIAYDVHVWGFHEAKYSIERVAVGLKYMELLLDTAKRVVGKSGAER